MPCARRPLCRYYSLRRRPEFLHADEAGSEYPVASSARRALARARRGAESAATARRLGAADAAAPRRRDAVRRSHRSSRSRRGAV